MEELKCDIAVSVKIHNKTFYSNEKNVPLPICNEIQESIKSDIKRQIDAYLSIFEKHLDYERKWNILRKYFIDKYNTTLFIKIVDSGTDRDSYYKYAIIEMETNKVLFTNTGYHNPEHRTGKDELINMLWEQYKDKIVE